MISPVAAPDTSHGFAQLCSPTETIGEPETLPANWATAAVDGCMRGSRSTTVPFDPPATRRGDVTSAQIVVTWGPSLEPTRSC